MLEPEASSLALLVGTWAKPPDVVGRAALIAAAVFALTALLPTGPKLLAGFFDFASLDDLARRRRFLTVAAFVAAFLSLGYLAYYLHGGPRLLESSGYFLEGRALSRGHLRWTILDPSASFRGPLLLFTEPNQVAAVFPPGFPLLLSLGFWFGAPMVIGPLLAAAAAAATYFLAKELAMRALDRASPYDLDVESIGRVAVAFSIVCAALRYHTAETLPHAATGAAIALALACALRARRIGDAASYALAGLLVGYVAATQPLAAVPIGVVVLALASKDARRGRSIAAAVALMLPGVALLLLANRAQTGSAFASGVSAYLASSDGPPGCWRWGTGPGVGCLYQQVELSAGQAPFAFGPFDAMKETARALVVHASDVANFEPLALLLFVPLFGARGRASGARLAFLVVAGLVVLQAPRFLPLGDAQARARGLAEGLCVQHALLAIGVAQILPNVAIARRALVFVAIACAGFGVHTSHAHAAWRAGRPKFEPDVLRESNVVQNGGLVFFDTPEGFNLASIPEAEPSHGIVAARLRNDDHDRLLYDLYGHPPVHKYVLPPAASGSTSAEPPTAPFWSPPLPSGGFGDEAWRFEAESDWPPVLQTRGWAHPVAMADPTCGPDAHALEIFPLAGQAGEGATVTIELPLPKAEEWGLVWSVVPRVLGRGGPGEAEMDAIDEAGNAQASWTWKDNVTTGACHDLEAQRIVLPKPVHDTHSLRKVLLRIRAKNGPVAIDRTLVRRGQPLPKVPE